jgi:hypothetical protein
MTIGIIFSNRQVLEDHHEAWRDSSDPNIYLAELRAKLSFWREDLGQNADAWPMHLAKSLRRAERKGTVDDFIWGLCNDVRVGKFLLGELAGLWRLHLPKDEGSLSDLWFQASIIQEGILARITAMQSFM